MATKYDTNNPVGSSDPRDLFDNSIVIDEFANSSSETALDRRGVSRKTLTGLDAEFDASQVTRESEFDASQADKDQRFNQLLAASGYVFLADYAAGIEVTEYNEVIRDGSGNLWRAASTTTLPYTTDGTGLPEGGAFVSAGDAVLRNDLMNSLANGQGALNVRGSVIYVDTIADLQALPTSELVEGQQVHVTGLRPFTWSTSDQRFDVDFDMFIVYGQSNAVGQATDPGDFSRPDFYPDNISDEVCLFWDADSETLTPITYGMDDARGHAWAAFANEYFKRSGRGVILLPGGIGGSTLSELSKGGARTAYADMTAELPVFEQYVIDNDISVINRSVLFSQGESDQGEPNDPGLGTSRNDYQALLDTLIGDMRADFGVDKFFISMVGNPQTRAENEWHPIQVAQEYITQSFPFAVMAFSGFGSFTVSNDMLRDGVHATQRGYNYMGYEMAQSADNVLNSETLSDEQGQERYGVINAPEDQVWRQVACTLRFDGVSGQWVMQKKDSSDYRLSLVGGIEVLPSGTEDRIRIYLTARSTAILSATASFNLTASQDGVKQVSLGFRNDASSGIFQSPGYAIDAYIHQDISFFIEADNEIRDYPLRRDASFNNSLSAISCATGSGGHKRIFHPRTEQVPNITMWADETFSDQSFVTFGRSDYQLDETRFKVSGADGSNNYPVAVKLSNCMINPLNANDGWEINIQAIVAEARY